MKSFLLKDKKPICPWKIISDETYFEGVVPEGYGLAINPHHPYIILDIDKHGDMDGFKNIPDNIYDELIKNHLTYPTKNNGLHVWMKYSGDKPLMNKTSGLGFDLRTKSGYVKWYLDGDIRDYLYLIKETSIEINNFLESHFLGINYNKENEE